jgi:6-phosphogluconolactonase
MTTDHTVVLFEDRTSLTAAVAERFLGTIGDVLAGRADANVVLTGGTVGIAVLEAINRSPRRDSIEWQRVNLWWGDERWLPRGHADRNDTQARAALLDHVDLVQHRVHYFGAPDESEPGANHGLDAAAAEYAAELAAAGASSALPRFDLTFLGLGPDAHVASLFPNREGIRERKASVIAVRNSPKPPPERLSLTLPTLNTSERIWLAVAGADKAAAVASSLSGADATTAPGAGVRGREETMFFLDQAAVSVVPPA